MGWFISNDEKYVSKDDNVKYKEEKYNGAAKYQKIEENNNYHDTFFATRTADGAYTEAYHGGNMTNDEKRQFGEDFDNRMNEGSHRIR